MGFGRAVETGKVWARWTEIVGAANATHCEPTSLRRGVLRVRASSPAWAAELNYLSGAIRDRANEVAGAGVVTEVRIWTGPGPIRSPQRSDRPAHLEPSAAPAKRPPAEDPAVALERAKTAWRRRRREHS
jgi:predicted nucleic acid-binding Zn ribbon protein